MNERAVTVEFLDQQVSKFREEIERIKDKLRDEVQTIGLINEGEQAEISTLDPEERRKKEVAACLTIEACDGFLAALTQLEDIGRTSNNPNERVNVLLNGMEACVRFQKQLDLALAQDPALHEAVKLTVYAVYVLGLLSSFGFPLGVGIVTAVLLGHFTVAALVLGLGVPLVVGGAFLFDYLCDKYGVTATYSKVNSRVNSEVSKFAGGPISIVPPDGLGFFASERLQAIRVTDSFEAELNRQWWRENIGLALGENAKQFTEWLLKDSDKTEPLEEAAAVSLKK